MAKESGSSHSSLEKNSVTNSMVSTLTIKSTDRDVSFGPWGTNIRAITKMMRDMAGVPCSGSTVAFTKDSGYKEFSRAWV